MNAIRTRFASVARRRRVEDRGAGLVEYSLLVALIAIVCIGAVAFFGQGSGNSVNNSKTCIEAAYDGRPLPESCK